jgi:hypothetical protein
VASQRATASQAAAAAEPAPDLSQAVREGGLNVLV